MRKIIVIFFVFAIWPLLSGAARVVPSNELPGVYIYSGGKAVAIAQGNTCYKTITEDSKKLFEQCNDSHRLMVDQDLIDKLKKEEKVIEVIFDKPAKIKPVKMKDAFDISKIFIPLTGEFASGYTTIFYANPTYDTPNQCINSIDKQISQDVANCAK